MERKQTMLKLAEDEIKLIAQRVLSLTQYNIEKEQASGVSEFEAFEVLDLTSWMCSNPEQQNFVIREILKSNVLSPRAKEIIRKLS